MRWHPVWHAQILIPLSGQGTYLYGRKHGYGGECAPLVDIRALQVLPTTVLDVLIVAPSETAPIERWKVLSRGLVQRLRTHADAKTDDKPRSSSQCQPLWRAGYPAPSASHRLSAHVSRGGKRTIIDHEKDIIGWVCHLFGARDHG